MPTAPAAPRPAPSTVSVPPATRAGSGAVAPNRAVARALARIARAAAADADDRPAEYLGQTAVRHGGE
ncbi:hypothetical protein [Alienimonas californiensis]|uniref:Uncharacterized protein n=1 Tax=Alienimonas californiensis TaxID=2527989 RepID=A0A517PEN7_9PLAN|nr:hypothetical protein [Alienimonas californiensis]QDT17840.1 hypothetical protein CA12_39750 [Alienimonas californiensis]